MDRTVGAPRPDVRVAGHLESITGRELRGWAVATAAGEPVDLLPVRVTDRWGETLAEGVASDYRIDVAEAGQPTGWAGFALPVRSDRPVEGPLLLEVLVDGRWWEASRADAAGIAARDLDAVEASTADVDHLLLVFGRAGAAAATVPKSGLVVGGALWLQASSPDVGHVQARLRLEPRERHGGPEPVLSVESDHGAVDRVDIRVRLGADTGRVAAASLVVPVRPMGRGTADVRLSRFDHEGRRVIADFRLPCHRWTDLLAEVPAHHCTAPASDPAEPLSGVWLEVMMRGVSRLDLGQVRPADLLGTGMESARVAVQRHLLDPWDDRDELPVERPAYSVVIPFHGNRGLTEHCVRSVLATAHGVPEIVLVDDGSPRGPAASLLRGVEGLVRRVDLGGNQGYTAAVNAGVQAASHDRVVVLNNDTRPTPGWDLPLLAALSKPDVLVSGPLSNAASYQSMPRAREADGSWAVNAFPAQVRPGDLARGLRRVLGGGLIEWPVLNGFCYAVRREEFLQIGGLDQAAFPSGYGEEVDLAFRARAAGLRSILCLDSFVYHYKSKSLGPERAGLSAAANEVLRARWGAELDAAVAGMDASEELEEVRPRFAELLASLASGAP